MKTHECVCIARGQCALHDRYKTQREFDICRGAEGIPDSIRQHYLDGWSGEPTKIADDPARPKPQGVVIAPEVFTPIRRDQWPAAAALIATLAAHGEVGVGDTIKRLLGTTGKLYQATFKAITGSDCTGCGFRQAKWNGLYPYGGS